MKIKSYTLWFILLGKVHQVNQLIMLSPEEVNANGSIYFDIDRFSAVGTMSRNYNYYLYPEKFSGQINGGKTITTIDNKGNPKNINVYLRGKNNPSSKKLSHERVSCDGNYGF